MVFLGRWCLLAMMAETTIAATAFRAWSCRPCMGLQPAGRMCLMNPLPEHRAQDGASFLPQTWKPKVWKLSLLSQIGFQLPGSSWAKRSIADFGWAVVSLRPLMKLILILGRWCLLPVIAEATVSATAFRTWWCQQWWRLSARAFASCWRCVWWILFQSRGHRLVLQSCPRQGSLPDLVGHRTQPGSGNGLCSSFFCKILSQVTHHCLTDSSFVHAHSFCLHTSSDFVLGKLASLFAQGLYRFDSRGSNQDRIVAT